MDKLERDGVSVEFIDVTPELAKEWLDEANKRNRSMRYRIVGSYATDMAAEEWDLNGETVKFDRDGVLMDGQHRLQGIVDSGTTQTLIVVRGLDPKGQATIDRNVTRKFSDTLKMDYKEPNHLALAALVRAVFMWQKGYTQVTSAYIPSSRQLEHVYKEHPELGFVVVRAGTVAKKSGLTPSVVGLAMWLFDKIDPKDSEKFFDLLADGERIGRGNPIWELRRQSLGWRGDKQRRNKHWQLAVIIKVWNLWRLGKNDVQQISFRMGGANPENFPKPE